MVDSALDPGHLVGKHLLLEERSARACIDLRGNARDAKFIRAVESMTDLRPPIEPGTSAVGLLASLLWLGPEQWLLVSETQSGEGLLKGLRDALQGVPSALTDVSHARVVYAVGGVNARAVLAKGCPLDLHDSVFPSGRCAQTLLAKASIIIHRSAPDPMFEIHVARSLRDYAWAWLHAAAEDLMNDACSP